MRTRHLLIFLTLTAPMVTEPAAAQTPDASRALERMAEADTNHDGVITKPEFLTYRAAQFERFDRNHDGYLTPDDIPFFLRGKGGRFDMDAMIAQFDTNHDGKISREEFIKGPTPVFDVADTNHDGMVTCAELEAAIARAKAMAQK